MKRTILTLVILIFLVSVVRADPSPLIKHYMTDPVSMFDWGLWKLESEIKSRFIDGDVPTSVSYSWNSNRIIIDITQYYDSSFSQSPEELCEFYTGFIRKSFWAIEPADLLSKNLEERIKWSAGCIGRYFSHDGFHMKTIDKVEDSLIIEQLIDIRVVVMERYSLAKAKKGDNQYINVKSISPFIGTGTTFIKKK